MTAAGGYALFAAQGRVADRTAGGMAGARLVADGLAARLGVSVNVVGHPSAPADDDWSVALAQAEPQLRALSAAVAGAYAANLVPLIALNKCPASLATLPVAAARWPDLQVLWIDAHGDFNTPATTASGYLGGMVLAGCCGLWDSGHGAGVKPANVVVLGGHDLDAEEARLMTRAGVRVVPPPVSAPLGVAVAAARNLMAAQNTPAAQNTAAAQTTIAAVLAAIRPGPLWIHIDCDALNPGQVPGDYAVPGGLSLATLQAVLRAVLSSAPGVQLVGFELAEFEAQDGTGAQRAFTAAGLNALLDAVCAPLTNP